MSTLILGGGMTGLAAGSVSGLPVFEALADPGGICSSYYIKPGSEERLAVPPADGGAYRFEIGGGHWIFGGDPAVLHFIQTVAPVRRYERVSSIFFPEDKLHVPYPLQYHLRYLDSDVANRALEEMAAPPGQIHSMRDWLVASFGPTLSDLFFERFHELYTAGLHGEVAPQDSYKSPVDLQTARDGASGTAPSVGYNTSYLYPEDGLDSLSRRLADECDMHYNKRVARIDLDAKRVEFADGDRCGFDTIASTLPLNIMMEMCGLELPERPYPHTAVLVLNVGAIRGESCPDSHWVYLPDTKSGFHRVGFYSNVDESFLPTPNTETTQRASIYVERAFPANQKPGEEETRRYADEVVEEMRSWGFIEETEVVDPTWIEVAYTWAWPNSTWKQQAIAALQERGVYQVGRYARWSFQGIADSLRDGFVAGGALKAR